MGGLGKQTNHHIGDNMTFTVHYEVAATGRRLYERVKAQTEQDAVTAVSRNFPIFSIIIRNVKKV